MSDQVKQYLSKGDFLSANPSSIHASGKKSKRFIRETEDLLFNTFGLDSNDWFLYFHSGATEGINNLFKGFGLSYYKKKSFSRSVMAESDHSCLVNQVDDLKLFNQKVDFFKVNQSGDFDQSELIQLLKQSDLPTLVNFTWVNNETGVVWDLDNIEKIKSLINSEDLFIHVDAVQSVGKISDWKNLSAHADAYTYSAHKFGAMKGVGFTFLKKKLPFSSLIKGGGQQGGLRSGTENTDGIYSIALAIEDLLSDIDWMSKVKQYKNRLEMQIKRVMGDSVIIVGENAKKRNENTISLVLRNVTADIAMMSFDMAEIDISSGSACSSGAIAPSRVLLSMGFHEREAKSALRLSLGRDTIKVDYETLEKKVLKVLERFKNC